MNDWLTRAKGTSIYEVAARLGYATRRNEIRGCPFCGSVKHGSSSIINGERFFCHRCRQGGDTVDLVAVKLTGSILQAGDKEQHRLVQEFFGSTTTYEAEPTPDPVYPPEDELRVLLASCVPIAASTRPGVASWLKRRGYVPSVPAGVLQGDVAFSWWPRWFGREWPVIVSAYDFLGRLKSVHGIATKVIPKEKKDWQHKTTWPRDVSSSALIFLDPRVARPWLQKKRVEPEAFLFAEGATDYLMACMVAERDGLDLGVVGIESGSFDAIKAIDWPEKATLFSAMDPDKAGEAYEKKLADALSPRRVRRLVMLPQSLSGGVDKERTASEDPR